jgi:hypothetical protein
MNTTPSDEVVLKQDVLGRVKTPKARREQLLDEFERSGRQPLYLNLCALGLHRRSYYPCARMV